MQIHSYNNKHLQNQGADEDNSPNGGGEPKPSTSRADVEFTQSAYRGRGADRGNPYRGRGRGAERGNPGRGRAPSRGFRGARGYSRVSKTHTRYFSEKIHLDKVSINCKPIQGFSYIRPLADGSTTKEAYVHSQLIKHQRWSSALAIDRQMSAEFEDQLKVFWSCK